MIEILTPEEVGELLRVSSNKIIAMARRGELPFLMLDGRMRFEAGDVEDWIKARKIGPGTAPVRTVTEAPND
jgi:excisionase family DNA binding protein